MLFLGLADRRSRCEALLRLPTAHWVGVQSTLYAVAKACLAQSGAANAAETKPVESAKAMTV